MTIEPMYIFADITTDTGLDQVPENKPFMVSDFDGLGNPKMLVLNVSTGITSTTTITQALQLPTVTITELNMLPAIINGGTY